MSDASWYRTEPARIARRMLAFAVLFALLGPLVGGPLASFAMWAPMAWDDPQGMGKFFDGLPYAWLGGGLFGLVPAAVTGAVAGWWRPRLRQWRIRWALVAIGMASTALWTVLFFRSTPLKSFIADILPVAVATAAVMALAITTFIGRRDARAPAASPH